MLSELSEIVENYKEVKIRKVKIKVYEITLEQLPKVFRALGSLDLARGSMVQVISSSYPIAEEIVSICIRESVEDMRRFLKPDELLSILDKVVEVNSDVFLGMIPQLKKIAEKSTKKMETISNGLGQSKG